MFKNLVKIYGLLFSWDITNIQARMCFAFPAKCWNYFQGGGENKGWSSRQINYFEEIEDGALCFAGFLFQIIWVHFSRPITSHHFDKSQFHRTQNSTTSTNHNSVEHKILLLWKLISPQYTRLLDFDSLQIDKRQIVPLWQTKIP